jgi:hypothetical protein
VFLLGRRGRWLTEGNRGQYSDAVLNELESQNDQHVEGILGKVKLLKDVRSRSPGVLALSLLLEMVVVVVVD